MATRRKAGASSAAVQSAGGGMDFNSMIGGGKSEGEAKKTKSSAPVINLPEDKHGNLDAFLEEKSKMKNAEAAMRQEEAEILEVCRKVHDENGLKGKFSNSYLVNGAPGKTVKFITTDRFSVSQEQESLDELRDTLGDDFGEVVVKQQVVQLKAEVFESEELQAELVKLIGNRFPDFFETTFKWVAKKGLNESIFKTAKTQDKLDKVREIVVPAKPSLR